MKLSPRQQFVAACKRQAIDFRGMGKQATEKKQPVGYKVHSEQTPRRMYRPWLLHEC